MINVNTACEAEGGFSPSDPSHGVTMSRVFRPVLYIVATTAQGLGAYLLWKLQSAEHAAMMVFAFATVIAAERLRCTNKDHKNTA